MYTAKKPCVITYLISTLGQVDLLHYWDFALDQIGKTSDAGQCTLVSLRNELFLTVSEQRYKGLSAGRISQVIVGDERQQYLLVIGQDVDDVQLAQRLAQANEIVLSWKCWMLCEQYMFEVEIMREDEAVKIDEGQPIEYVSEFRMVTLVLVSLEFHKTAWMLHLCHLIQEAALYISTIIEKRGGQLSGIFMFEKGCMFLCVFGLPGDKKPDECAHALESSFSIFSFCWENLAKTKLVSISITNGPVFSGVVGAVARHEYTVIGPKVSLAARMITAYPGLVSCDEVTYLRYMLPACNFKNSQRK
ncbi:adenylate cyclase type 10-like [Pongo pygmaeus]|uniref:adenylate cyclase type 10-like n=1 Tax=Pongo pygmaeus TaxID=9600 RepID=UPI0023E1E433|nr:adenylate cyclase type 10-like [Pongo pygmaeus]